jgi:hypothetical protein
MTAPLTAEIFARAIIAAAVSWGDSPIEAMTTKHKLKRRAMAPAAIGVSQSTGVSLERVAGVLGLKCSNVFTAAERASPGFTKARDAAAEAVAYHLRGLELAARAEALELARIDADEIVALEPAAPAQARAEPASETVVIHVGDDVVVFEAEPAMSHFSPSNEAAEINTPPPRPAPSRPTPKPAAKPVARNTGRAMPKGARFESLGEGVQVIRLKPITDSVVRHAAAQIARGADIEDLAELFSVDVEHLRRRLNAGAAA